MSNEAQSEFVESLGIIFQNEGLPRIAGRVLGHLIVSEEPCSFGQLVDTLQVSKGSVSTNTRLLVELGAVERTARSGERQDYFRLADAPYEQLLERAIDRAERARQTLQKAGEKLARSGGSSRERVAELILFYDVVVDSHKQAARRLRERRA